MLHRYTAYLPEVAKALTVIVCVIGAGFTRESTECSSAPATVPCIKRVRASCVQVNFPCNIPGKHRDTFAHVLGPLNLNVCTFSGLYDSTPNEPCATSSAYVNGRNQYQG